MRIIVCLRVFQGSGTNNQLQTRSKPLVGSHCSRPHTNPRRRNTVALIIRRKHLIMRKKHRSGNYEDLLINYWQMEKISHKRQPRSCFELFVTRLNKSLRKLIVKFRCINKVQLLSFFLDYGFISGFRDVRKAKQRGLKIIDLLFPQSSFAMRTKRCYQIFHKAR